MKTPKRKYYFYEIYQSGINPENGDIIMDVLNPGLYEARWKRKNKVRQLKRTITNLHKKLDDIDTGRIVARAQLGTLRDFFLSNSRAANNYDAKVYWLKQTRPINLILGVTISDAELEAQFRGEPTLPATMEYTDEERELLKKIREEEK